MNLASRRAAISQLLGSDPAAAEAAAREDLATAPGEPDLILLLAAARRRQGDAEGARDLLAPLASADGVRADLHQELGLALATLGESEAAIAQLATAVAKNPQGASAWRALGDQHFARGERAAADAAYAQAIRASTRDAGLLRAAEALVAGDLAAAEPILRARLKRAPTDVAAIRMMAELASRLGRYGDAAKLLARALELAPGFRAARHNYALVLHRQNRAAEALIELDLLLLDDPHNPGLANLKAAVLGRIGEFAEALDIYGEVLERVPDQPKVWMSYGHALKTVGRQQDSVAAYRRSIALEPRLGEAWWSLANLKRVKLGEGDRLALREALAGGELAPEDRFHLHFALGKAEEDAGDYAAAFAQYEAGNRQRRQMVHYDPAEIEQHLARSRALFTERFFAEREEGGCTSTEPIFIVGMPRAGSTLIEQILSSHSMVEGTMELPDLPQIAGRLGGQKRGAASAYPEVLAQLTPAERTALGEDYLERTRIQRKTGAPVFLDKMPNNFLHVGLIRLILPRARIIDARRHPLACCFSNYKQHFARGQAFAYDLAELGQYYRCYAGLMAHFDAVQPGAVTRVFYEAVVADLEGEVRRLLAALGLPFEEACLAFHASERAVRTASSEQVREPIYRQGLDQWRHFAPWLGPLEEALGPVLGDYPFAT